MKKNIRTHWRDGKWVVDVQFALTEQQLLSIRDFLIRVQTQRLAGLAPGPVRDECVQTIAALNEHKLVQNIAGTGDRVLFDAYKSDKIIVGA